MRVTVIQSWRSSILFCKSELKDDLKKYKMEAEADNAWVYGRDKEAIDRFVKKFRAATKTEAGVKLLIKNASKK